MSSQSTNPFSCVRCSQRKVKCDKLNPCANCDKSKVECVFRVPAPARRRKKVFSEGALLARLKRYEELLKNNGIVVEEAQDLPVNATLAESSTPPLRPDTDAKSSVKAQTTFLQYQADQAGQLLVDRGKSRFIENNLWVSASTEFQPEEAIIEQHSDDEDEVGSLDETNTEFTFGHAPSSGSIRQFHPSPDHILLLWRIFLENVDPLTKLVHRPTLEDAIVRASCDVDGLSNGFESLLFSIYNAAVTSLDQDDCVIKFGETRKTLLNRYRYATRKALTRARFMATSDIQVLQAFTLYLLLTREVYDSRTMWALAGVARRVAHGMGMHRDGTSLGVPPFEAEMRRRLWWQISILDFRSAELCGSAKYHEFASSDVQAPGNLDDTDIHPTMEELPKSHERATEMIACLLRCEFGCFWREKYIERANASLGNTRLLASHLTGVEEKTVLVNELERRIEERYLRYCDPTIPIQFMTIIIGRTAISSMRLVIHCEKRYARLEDIPSAERDRVLDICIKMIGSDNLAHSTRALRRFSWHNVVHFQWQALIYLLYELKHQTIGDKIDKAWSMVDELFTHHPDFITDNRKPLIAAVGSLCVKAYHAREAALREKTRGMYPKGTPDYIEGLRKYHKYSTLSEIPAVQSDRRDTEVTPSIVEQSYRRVPYEPTSSQDNLGDLPGKLRSTESHVQGSFSIQSTAQTHYMPTDQFMFGSEPELAQDLAMAGAPMDWTHWDDMIQEHGYDV